MKTQRQKLITDIIENEIIDTQESLQKALENHGVKVTQATVSRDIKELNLIKSIDENGMYRYFMPMVKGGTDFFGGEVNISIIANAILSVDYAINTVVVKCHAGMAQGVCAKIDSANISNCLGTIAGDDTIFILMRTEEYAGWLTEKLNTIIANNEVR